jgi:iron complex transport system substrate-binding protein
MRNAINLLAAVIAIAIGVAAGLRPVTEKAPISPEAAVVDATGTRIPLRDAQRVVSLSILSDRILSQILPTSRWQARCSWSHGDWMTPIQNVPALPGPEALESILALHADLVIVAGADSLAVQRLREHDQVVFALGDLNGWESCERNIQALGNLTGQSHAAKRLITEATTRMALLRRLAPSQPERACCLTVVDTKIYGGTIGTAYHDMLRLAGCIDIAAESFRGWPTWTMEDIHQLNPEVIVTSEGGAAAIRRLSGADHLQARIIEIASDQFDDPGLGIIPAAEALRFQLAR